MPCPSARPGRLVTGPLRLHAVVSHDPAKNSARVGHRVLKARRSPVRMPCAHARGPKLPPRARAMCTTRRRVGWSYHQQQDPAGGERTSARTSFVMPESSYPCTSSNPLNVERTDAASSSSHARDPSHVRRVRAERPLSSHDRRHAMHTALTSPCGSSTSATPTRHRHVLWRAHSSAVARMGR